MMLVGSDDLISERETVDKKGNLVIIENIETRLNLKVGDEIGKI
ncbi:MULTISPECIES: hypothetical protein [unclassified Chamaesiphon]|nr:MULTISPECIES: hypothetical protein [unclassified Chamaesiphon]